MEWGEKDSGGEEIRKLGREREIKISENEEIEKRREGSREGYKEKIGNREKQGRSRYGWESREEAKRFTCSSFIASICLFCCLCCSRRFLSCSRGLAAFC